MLSFLIEGQRIGNQSASRRVQHLGRTERVAPVTFAEMIVETRSAEPKEALITRVRFIVVKGFSTDFATRAVRPIGRGLDGYRMDGNGSRDRRGRINARSAFWLW